MIVLVGDQRYFSQEMLIFSDYVKRDVVYGGVTETIDFPMSNANTRALAYAIAYVDDDVPIRVRFVGDKNRDFVLPMEVRWVWQDMIRYYDAAIQ